MGVWSLAVVAALLLGGCATTESTSDARPGAPAETSASPVADPSDVPPCPRWDTVPAYPGGDLPDGATSLRVCPGEETIQGPPHWRAASAAPRDALTTGVDDLVVLLNALPDWEGLPEGTYCTQEGRPRIHYVFGYPDGSTRSVTYGYGACHLLELDPPGDFPTEQTIAKEDGGPFMDAVADGLVAQRRGAEPPRRVPVAPACVPNLRSFTTLPTAELELSTAALCVLDGRRWRRAVLPADLVRKLSDEYAATATTGGECASAFGGKVVGWSTWGDPVELQLWGRCAMAGSPWSPEPVPWTISPALADALGALPLGPPGRQR